MNKGEVKVTKNLTEKDAEGNDQEFIMKLGLNSYFGERALLSGDKRAANVLAVSTRVDCYSIGRNEFEEVLGPLQLIIDADRIKRENFADNKLRMLKNGHLNGLHEDLKINDFENRGTILDIDIGTTSVIVRKETRDGIFSLISFDKNAIFADKKTHQVMGKTLIYDGLLLIFYILFLFISSFNR